MAQRVLMIGAGGSGGKTLRYTWRELNNFLLSHKWDRPFPRCWQFLHVDVPQHVDVVMGDVPAEIGNDARYLGLAHVPERYRDYDRRIAESGPLLPAYAGWRPDPTKEYIAISSGAGQRRAVGRVVTVDKLADVVGALREAVNTLDGPGARQETEELDRHLGVKAAAQEQQEPIVCVVSSLGGGSGSGAFLDIIEVIRSFSAEGRQWLEQDMLNFLYAADVFQDLPESARRGVEPNTLAALSELLNASEHEGPVPGSDSAFLRHAGGIPHGEGPRIGPHTFIIGKKNSAMTLGTGLAVFRATGKAIASLITDDRVNDQFRSYIGTNGEGAAMSEGFTLADKGRCSSLGYSSVSLGNNLFAQYAAERLARRAYDRLLTGHLEGIPNASLLNPETVLKDKADMLEREFIEACKLSERNEDDSPSRQTHNEVLDALRDGKAIRAKLEETKKNVAAKLSERGGDQEAGVVWFERLKKGFDAETVPFNNWVHEYTSEKARQWVLTVQRGVATTTMEYAATAGLPVAIELLDRLAHDVQEAAKQLDREGAQLAEGEREALGRLSRTITKFSDKVMGTNHEAINDGFKVSDNLLQRGAEGRVVQLAARLLRDLAVNLLQPLRATLIGAERTLIAAAKGKEQQIVEQWTRREVAAHLRPAENELLLQEVSDFPERLDRLLASLDDGGFAGEGSAVTEIIAGGWPMQSSEDAQSTLISPPGRVWAPSDRDAKSAGVPPQAAQFSLDSKPLALRRLAEHWTRERKGLLSTDTATTLAEWLAAGDEQPTRARLFADLFSRAVASAVPLVSVSQTAHEYVHGHPPGRPRLIVSDIPMSEEHPAFPDVRAALESAGMEMAQIGSTLNPNAGGDKVSVNSFLGAYVHPIVFDSVTAPILRDWQSRSSRDARKRFWEFRRARRLPAFIPLSQAKQGALVRGWLVADLLGHVSDLSNNGATEPIALWTPTGTRYFPAPLLAGDTSDAEQVLPALMESLPLAMLAYGNEQPGEVEAFQRLVSLGEEYRSADGVLARWIVEGHVAEGAPDGDGRQQFPSAPVPPAEFADRPESTPEERRTAILAALDAFIEGCQGDVRMPITPETSTHVPPRWEVAELLIKAGSEIRTQVAGVAKAPEGPRKLGGGGGRQT